MQRVAGHGRVPSAMAAPAAPKKSLPILVHLDVEYTEGGYSPMFNSKGRSALASLTTEPTNADLFVALAHDGSMGALNTFLDTAQPSVGYVALVCYIFTGVVVVAFFFLLPLVAFGLRRYTATIGVGMWLGCEVILLACAGVQLICLMTMIRTWYGMSDGLGAKLPEVYEWTFELLRNFTEVAVDQYKSSASPSAQKALDAVATTTLKGIKNLRGNISAWEARYEGYKSLEQAVTGPVPICQMILLAVALTVTVASAALSFATWNRRKASLEAGKRSPTFVALIAFGGAGLLLAHMAMALPIIARWLPLCVLTDTYVCGPYRDGTYAVLDDGATKIWPEASRPDPFCRMVPGKLASSCSAKGKAGIWQLPSCPSKGAKKALTIHASDGEAELRSFLQQRNNLPLARAEAAGNTEKQLKADCYSPYRIMDTDMKAACPLFTDDLVAHWMALVISTVFGMLTVFAVSAIGAIFMAVGEKTTKKTKTPSRKRRRIKRKKKSKKKAKKKGSEDKKAATPPATPAPISTGSEATPTGSTIIRVVSSPLDLAMKVPFPVPVPVPIPVKTAPKRHRRHPEAGPPAFRLTPPPWYPLPPPPFMSAPFLAPPAFVPQPATPVASAAGVSLPLDALAMTAPTILRRNASHLPAPPCIHRRSYGGAGSASATGKVRRWSVATETCQQRMPALVSSSAAQSSCHQPLAVSLERSPSKTTSSTTVAFASSRPGSQGACSCPKVTRFAACTTQRPA